MSLRSTTAVALLAIASFGCGDKGAPPSSVTPSPLHKFSETFASYDPGGHPTRSEARVEGTEQYFEKNFSKPFQTARCDTDGYTLKVPNGSYRVFLNFNEPEHDAPGERVFDVLLQGKVIAEKLDVFAVAGKNRAHQLVSPYVNVTDGHVRIEFRRIAGVPCIAYISVGGDIAGASNAVGRVFFQHIDCGAIGADYGM